MGMVDRRRNETMTIRLSDDEDRMLRAVAEHQGLSVSDAIRQYIRRAFFEAFLGKQPKK
jgi:uncharacterized protein (DUF1778 family)